MPFGKKPGSGGAVIDFDAVYGELIKPAVESAGLVPLRADEEQACGIIHKPMFERLLLCEYAVADLSMANPNVYYELGIRHATRPWSTVLLFRDDFTLPFDVRPLRAVPYRLVGGRPDPAHVADNRAALTDRLRHARTRTTDSPLFQLLTDRLRPTPAGWGPNCSASGSRPSPRCRTASPPRDARATSTPCWPCGSTSATSTPPRPVS